MIFASLHARLHFPSFYPSFYLQSFLISAPRSDSPPHTPSTPHPAARSILYHGHRNALPFSFFFVTCDSLWDNDVGNDGGKMRYFFPPVDQFAHARRVAQCRVGR